MDLSPVLANLSTSRKRLASFFFQLILFSSAAQHASPAFLLAASIAYAVRNATTNYISFYHY